MARAGLILSAGTLQSIPLLDRLAPARAAGFFGISVFAADVEALAAQGVGLAEMRRRIADAGLFVHEVEIVGNWLPGAAVKPLPGWLAGLLDRSTPERLAEMAAGLGAKGLTVAELRGVVPAPEAAAEAFARICALGAQAGLHVALEFVPTGGIPSLSAGWEVVRRAGAANGGLLVDSWHFFRSGSDLATLAALPGAAILSVQLSDGPVVPAVDLDREMVSGRLLPGEGRLNLAGFVAALRLTGTAAPFAVEVFSDALARRPVAEAAEACMAAARRLIGGD